MPGPFLTNGAVPTAPQPSLSHNHSHSSSSTHSMNASTSSTTTTIASTQKSNQTPMILMMLVDGVGLALIAACTILEGFDLWKHIFRDLFDTNEYAMTFWFSGRGCQVFGLLLLISHAASFQVFPVIEQGGMFFLTLGPLLNMAACTLFNSGTDVTFSFNKQWLSSECLELLGISILDLSLVDFEEHWVLTAEVLGFTILALAAVLEIKFVEIEVLEQALDAGSAAGSSYFTSFISNILPSSMLSMCPSSISFRHDMLHLSDCFGLGLLTVVAIAQFRMKVAKHIAHEAKLLETERGRQQSHIHSSPFVSQKPMITNHVHTQFKV